MIGARALAVTLTPAQVVHAARKKNTQWQTVVKKKKMKTLLTVAPLQCYVWKFIENILQGCSVLFGFSVVAFLKLYKSIQKSV